MKFAFFEDRAAFQAVNDIRQTIQDCGEPILVEDVIDMVEVCGGSAIDDLQPYDDLLGWKSIEHYSLYWSEDYGKWILDLLTPTVVRDHEWLNYGQYKGFGQWLKPGVKVDEDKDKEIELVDASLRERIDDLARRVQRLEHPEWKYRYSRPYSEFCRDHAETEKTRSFLDRVNDLLDSLTGGNS